MGIRLDSLGYNLVQCSEVFAMATFWATFCLNLGLFFSSIICHLLQLSVSQKPPQKVCPIETARSCLKLIAVPSGGRFVLNFQSLFPGWIPAIFKLTPQYFQRVNFLMNLTWVRKTVMVLILTPREAVKVNMCEFQEFKNYGAKTQAKILLIWG